ncbi:hypothetical protein SPRG_00918 [Saprolegnia parasitica CBS 223.65]|uniref:Uncharacterized protein n=1 Tax=Saprolegnia parasitica (strain CBS 223.65) TaxID=695850 RepID=A0A067CWI0_SAPPC|nr:hypothetical protein SPRG_00918 [Saprolegnia parasitica CBS 223.65]KDO34858.1 hypothetical protein SPRG_00918 [Saprolegnia parasitica CBS 223.65]|eukprot:XP_012194520.1 hypothetical protein SPRG_00918 [Saprolegnia parasitica CBS 223.65]
MNRKIGFDNRVCYERDVLKAQKLHQDRLRSMQSSTYSPAASKLDNSPPKHYVHLDARLKTAQLKQERYQQIFEENQHLVRKMTRIVAAHPTERAVEFRPGMRLTVEQTPMLDSYLSPHSLSRGCAIEKGSLNSGFRQREHAKIEAENRKMLARLTTKKSAYSASRWDREYKESLVRFKHVHHDATVGHLPPKQRDPSPYHARDKSALPVITPRDEVMSAPSPHRPSRNPSNAPSSPRNAIKRGVPAPSGSQRPLTVATSPSRRRQTYNTKSVPVLLLEATTSLGVHFTIEEIQTAFVTPTETHLGDQGLLIRAKKDARSGECLVTLPRLKDVAQSLPGRSDIEEKLRRIQTNANVGNFPRVSEALDEENIKVLLIKLVQSVRVSVGHDEGSFKLSLEVAAPAVAEQPLSDALKPKRDVRTVLSLFASREFPSRSFFKHKGARYLCRVHVYELRRLLTFHALDVASGEAVNFQFTDAELLLHFNKGMPATVHDANRSLLKLARKRIQL